MLYGQKQIFARENIQIPSSTIEVWQEEYNTFRPHSRLGDLTPEMSIGKQVKQRNSLL
ncbi:MAG: integrase core domain-containing protein [Sphingobacterium sp.]